MLPMLEVGKVSETGSSEFDACGKDWLTYQ